MVMKDITILLTVYNRPHFTRKWLDYANQIRLPFKIFIADGGKNNFVKHIIKNNKYQNIKVTYYKFKYYRNFNNFFEKFYLSCKKIKSEFIYICEDDDYIYPKNILKSYNFLKKNSDYSCSGGVNFRYDSFSLKNKLYAYFHLQDNEINKSVKNNSSLDRLIKLFSNLNSNWNCLHRKKTLLKTFSFMKEKNFKNYLLTENVFIAFTTYFGKINRFNHLEYLKTDDILQSASNIFSRKSYINFFYDKKKKSELTFFFKSINSIEKNKFKLQEFENLFIKKFYEYELILLQKEKMISKLIFLFRYSLTAFLKKIRIFYYLKLIKFNYQNLKRDDIFFDDPKSMILYYKDKNFIKKVLNFLKSNSNKLDN